MCKWSTPLSYVCSIEGGKMRKVEAAVVVGRGGGIERRRKPPTFLVVGGTGSEEGKLHFL